MLRRIVRPCDIPGLTRSGCGADYVRTTSGAFVRTNSLNPVGAEPSPGDFISIFAYGLGRTTPLARAGEMAKDATFLAEFPPEIFLQWLGPDGTAGQLLPVQPQYVGLAPGTIGMLIFRSPRPPVACRPADNWFRRTC